MNTGEHVWKTTFATMSALRQNRPAYRYRELRWLGVTKGGVLFIGASRDGFFRAYNKRTGSCYGR
jgi:quinoprotein glucose dehydrogenase